MVPMKHTPFFWRRFLARVMQIWYQILAPSRTLFYSKPESFVHETKKYCTKVHDKHIVHKLKFLLTVQCNAQQWT